MDEPRIHSHITDALPENHPLAYKDVRCQGCSDFLHAANNECMQTWIETGRGNLCLGCFAHEAPDTLDDDWGLHRDPARETE
jgi:hypothetical protein